MEEKAMQDTKTGKMVGNTPKKRTIQSIRSMGGKIMASGKQYYKYKAKADLLDKLLYDIETLLIMDDKNTNTKIQNLALLYRRYKELENEAL